MKKSMGIGLIAVVFTLVSIIVAPQALAQTRTVTKARCEAATARLELRSTTVKTAAEKLSGVYDSLKVRFDSVVTGAQEASYPELTDLTDAQTSVKEAIDTFKEEVTTYTTALDAAQSVTCGESNGAFVTNLTGARTAMVDVRTASIEVRSTFRQDVIPALKAYATWVGTQTQQDTDTEGVEQQ